MDGWSIFKIINIDGFDDCLKHTGCVEADGQVCIFANRF